MLVNCLEAFPGSMWLGNLQAGHYLVDDWAVKLHNLTKKLKKEFFVAALVMAGSHFFLKSTIHINLSML